MKSTLTLILTLCLACSLQAQECPKGADGAGCDKKGTGLLGGAAGGECDKGGEGVSGVVGNPVDHFAKRDANGDGLLTPAEAPELFEAGQTLDSNNDGGISRAELLAGDDSTTAAGKIRANVRERAEKKFAKMDADGSGTISSSEWKGKSEGFAKADTDGDGELTKAELSAHIKKAVRGKMKDRFAKIDTDGDGKVSATEFRGPADKFDELDQNGDGYLTKDEMPNRRKERRERRRGKLLEMDTNGDGQVSKDEFTGDAEKFDKLDRNGDGVISKDDRPERKGKKGRKGKGPRGPRPGGDAQ